mgnify:CR=1 FL=1
MSLIGKTYYFNIMKYHSRDEEIENDEIIASIHNEAIQNRGFIGLPVNKEISINNIEMLKVEEKKITKEKSSIFE